MVIQNEKGYTLLEMLLVLSIFLMVSSFFPLLFSVLSQWIEQPSSLHPFEWEVATAQITMDVREANKIVITEGMVTLEGANSELISYESYGDLMRRTVNGTGHEVVMQNVNLTHFSYIDGGISITVTDLDDKEYKMNVYRFGEVMNNE
ncbi:competence protein ComGF [Bacillus mesophilus]|uniref:Prepilin-type N-terminal cleavage/methylation domain-containing protein n=1 Tax=Bacillus mesophilus TaxID=1808955 RepID=A0A6M0Q5G5_9BACI|nr:competence type IV pilus minor pilin ComGF [Bacillus mesophilus]MBM7660863.1 competence protein ComGF [Bacillus mesophilus]NEY71591.1 prepilin-type N-terminal cleavage/methylation domain-containing protein [Bacillus mesophilus]